VFVDYFILQTLLITLVQSVTTIGNYGNNAALSYEKNFFVKSFGSKNKYN